MHCWTRRTSWTSGPVDQRTTPSPCIRCDDKVHNSAKRIHPAPDRTAPTSTCCCVKSKVSNTTPSSSHRPPWTASRWMRSNGLLRSSSSRSPSSPAATLSRSRRWVISISTPNADNSSPVRPVHRLTAAAGKAAPAAAAGSAGAGRGVGAYFWVGVARGDGDAASLTAGLECPVLLGPHCAGQDLARLVGGLVTLTPGTLCPSSSSLRYWACCSKPSPRQYPQRAQGHYSPAMRLLSENCLAV